MTSYDEVAFHLPVYVVCSDPNTPHFSSVLVNYSVKTFKDVTRVAHRSKKTAADSIYFLDLSVLMTSYQI